MGTFLETKDFPSRETAYNLSKSGLIGVFLDVIREKMVQHTPIDERYKNSTNKPYEYGEDDEITTISGVETSDKPQFNEEKLYNHSADKKMEDKKHIYSRLAKVEEYLCFLREFANNEVAVTMAATGHIDSFNPNVRGQLFSDNALDFEGAAKPVSDNFVGKYLTMSLKGAIYNVVAALPEDKELHDFLDAMYSRIAPNEVGQAVKAVGR